MYQIVSKEKLAAGIYKMDILAPRVAHSAKPGQFIIVRMDEQGERIPLTICDYDREKGTVTIVFQEVGSSTKKMAQYEVNEYFQDFAGPLGKPADFLFEDMESLKNKNILFVAGGVGTAPVYPEVKWLNEHGIKSDVIIGSKSKDYVILEEEMKKAAGNVYVATDDGSYGFNGRVTDVITELVEKQGKKYDLVVAIGPLIMMKFVSMLTKKYNIETIVSINTIMVDGTGMCGACRVTVDGKMKFVCVDGPEFDGHLVDFDEAMRRQTMFKTEEGRKKYVEENREHSHEGCGCNHGGAK